MMPSSDIGSSTIDISSDEDDEEDKAMEQVDMLKEQKETRLEKAFRVFDRENPQVYQLFKKYTFDAINAGFTHYSVSSIIERIRWHTNIETKGDLFKINNNHRAYFARKFMEEFPRHKDFFLTRVTEAERRARVS